MKNILKPNQILIFLALCIFSSISCVEKINIELNAALKNSGKNKSELKTVLKHYKENPADSLKYQAACFLIENMQWHYGSRVEPSEDFWDLFVMEGEVVRNYLPDPEYFKNEHALKGYKYSVKKYLVKKAIENTECNNNFTSDLEQVNAGAIIENIDNAFAVKNNWIKNPSMDFFNAYILPYRVSNEPIYPVREKLMNHFAWMNETDSLNGDIYKTISYLNAYLKLYHWDYDEKQVKMPDLGFYNILFWNTKSLICSHHVAIYGQVLRAIGIPVTEVFTPSWRFTRRGHNWCGLPVTADSLVLFSAFYQNPGEVYLPHSPSRATKLYMKTFAAQTGSPYFLKADGEELPLSFESPCIRDVTSDFVPVKTFNVKLKEVPKEKKLCWFSIFIQGTWVPIGWGKIDRNTNTSKFQDIPAGLTGLACFMQNGKIIPCSELFTVTKDSVQETLPSGEKLTQLLTRKFPVKTRMQYFIKEIIGAKIQGANHADFSDSVTLFTVRDTLMPWLQDLTLQNDAEYRYYRIVSPGWLLHIAELEFLSEQKLHNTVKASPLPVYFKNEPEQKCYYKFVGNIIAKKPDSTVFDGNMLTYSTEKWVGIDLGAPHKINRVRIAPRNADNGIVPGDKYQLMYWDNNWIPVGIKEAKYNYIEFENVPSNTLYWLKNLDHGKEEQPFFYESGKQVFSNL